MKKCLYLATRIITGFIICAIGMVLAINSNLGLSPWDVFHQGLSNNTFLTIGQASIFMGVIIVGVSCALGQKVGIATLANMILIGVFIDGIIYLDFIPQSNNLVSGIIMIIMSIIFLAYGSYLYISCGLGCGPRDGLMVILVQKTKKPVKLIRGIMEVTVIIAGYMLGGTVGVGTLITGLGIGHCLQLVCKIFKFDMNAVDHINLKDTYVIIKESLQNNQAA